MKTASFFIEARKKLSLVFSSFFAPENCACCGKKSFSIPLCKSCSPLFFSYKRPLQDEVCHVCGKALLSEEKICMECRKTHILKTPSSVTPVHSYRLWKKNILFEWKNLEKRALSYHFASLLEKVMTSLSSEKLPLVPVPPRPGKIHKKGWDQMEDVCRILEKKRGWKVLRYLERFSFLQQKKKDRNQRLLGGGKSYGSSKMALKAKKNGLIPEKVFLADDVLTTGVTVEECSMRLKELGVKEVHVITFFIVD